MTGYLREYDGTVYQLPKPVEWALDYTLGVPCDSFLLRLVYDPLLEEHLHKAIRLEVREGEETVFLGVVDEYEVSWSAEGAMAEVNGRGMAALLLDNEAEAAEYQLATLDDLLRDHVTPYGIQVGEAARLPAVPGFSVASGSSEWEVVYNFARYYGGVAPRFDRSGKLVLTGWEDGQCRLLDGTVPITSLSRKETRYGVLSEIWVRDKTRMAVERVYNEEFRKEGGCCRRVITMPGQSNYKAMRYSGQFQLDRSRSERYRVEATVPQVFWGWPGELVQVEREQAGLRGQWRILEARTGVSQAGEWTRLTLGEPDALI